MAANGRWSPRAHYARHERHVANDAAAAANALYATDAANRAADRAATRAATRAAARAAPDDWMQRFGNGAPAVNPAPGHHHWRQNFNPDDFLPFQYDVVGHLGRMGLGANRDPPPQPDGRVVRAANSVHAGARVIAPIPLANPVLAFPPLAPPPPPMGHGSLTMDEFLRAYPHIGVGQTPAQPLLMYPVGNPLFVNYPAEINCSVVDTVLRNPIKLLEPICDS